MEIVKTESKAKIAYEKVEMREPKVADMIAAQRISGQSEGAAYEAALLAQICTFDGKKLQMEDVTELEMEFFFQLKDSMLGGGLTKLVQQFLDSAAQAGSAPKVY